MSAVWSFRVLRKNPTRLEIEGRAGHLAWTFRAAPTMSGPKMDQLGPRWSIECNDVELAYGAGVPSVPMAVALVVDALAPYLDKVPS